jgi:hypothetical protein
VPAPPVTLPRPRRSAGARAEISPRSRAGHVMDRVIDGWCGVVAVAARPAPTRCR